MSLTKPILIAILVIVCCWVIVAQASREEGIKAIKSKLLDVSSAQYKLEATGNGRGYQFCNASAIRVVRFRFGCAERKNAGFKILDQRPFDNLDIAAADGNNISCRIWDSNHGFFPGEACKKGKLAVTEVDLADDSVWKLK